MAATMFSKYAGPHLAQHLLHAAGFHLENADGIALANHAKGVIKQGALFIALGLFMAIGNAVEGVLDAAMARDQLTGFAHDGERRQAEEVHLEQADVLGGLHGELRDRAQSAAGGVFAGDAMQRHQVDQGAIGDDDAGGMGGGVARHALQIRWRCR